MITTIHNNDLKAAMEADVALIDFSAVWCGPCKMTAPVLEAISEKMAGKVAFFNCDVDENMEVAMKYGIQSIPALVLMKKGQIVDTKIGFSPEPVLQQWLDSNL